MTQSRISTNFNSSVMIQHLPFCITGLLGWRAVWFLPAGRTSSCSAQKDWKKWKRRLFHPGWEVEKPEIGDGATKGGREEVHSFSRFFIRHPGYQGSRVSKYRLEIHSNLVTDGQWYLHVILLLLFC